MTMLRNEPQTPKQAIDEVMVAYKGKTAGNLRQYIKTNQTNGVSNCLPGHLSMALFTIWFFT